jgi:hypothetical protein
VGQRRSAGELERVGDVGALVQQHEARLRTEAREVGVARDPAGDPEPPDLVDELG